MKKYLSILLVILLITGIAYAATPGYRANPGTGDVLGQGKYQSDAHKIFRMVRYMPSTCTQLSSRTLSADSIVIWDLTSDDGVTVTTSTTSYDSAVAGIIVQDALTPDLCMRTAAGDVGHRNWTWLQTYGLSEVDVSPNTAVGTAGMALAVGDVEGEAVPFLPSTSNALLQGNAGFFYDAAAAAATEVEVFLTVD